MVAIAQFSSEKTKRNILVLPFRLKVNKARESRSDTFQVHRKNIRFCTLFQAITSETKRRVEMAARRQLERAVSIHKP